MEQNVTKTQVQVNLAKQLSARHSKDELIQLNIMRDDDQVQSVKAKMEDALSRRLQNRPTKQRLIELGVLKDEDLTSSILQKKLILKKAKVEDILNRKLANRPTQRELEEKNVLVSTEKQKLSGVQRALIGQNLEHLLAGKYSNRFSSAEAGEAIPLINWADDLIADYSDSPPQADSPSEENVSSRAESLNERAKVALKKRPGIHRELSFQSMQQKTLFIMGIASTGRFVCRNCCSEFFEGPEMASPRYSYHNFFDEEDWHELALREPYHNDEAKRLNLCNMCFGVCSCGIPLRTSVCDNCGSIKPITSDQQWRAPDYPRPKTVEEWQEMRMEQLNHYKHNYPDGGPPERAQTLRFNEEEDVLVFERYRFRNTLTDEGMFLEECEDAPAGVLFSVEGEEDQVYEVETETDGYYYLKADSAGNLFVVAVSDEDKSAKNSTRVYLHDPAKNWFYYGDSGAGKIFCWDPVQDTVRPVG